MPPAAAPNSFSVNRISVLFNWQNFNSCKFFCVFLMKTAAAKFLICISIDSVNRISVLFNWQNFNSCKFFSVFLMKTAAAKFLICISIDYYSIKSKPI